MYVFVFVLSLATVSDSESSVCSFDYFTVSSKQSLTRSRNSLLSTIIWLISICHKNVYLSDNDLPNSQQTGRKIVYPVSKFGKSCFHVSSQILFPVKIFFYSKSYTIFGQIADPKIPFQTLFDTSSFNNCFWNLFKSKD